MHVKSASLVTMILKVRIPYASEKMHFKSDKICLILYYSSNFSSLIVLSYRIKKKFNLSIMFTLRHILNI